MRTFACLMSLVWSGAAHLRVTSSSAKQNTAQKTVPEVFQPGDLPSTWFEEPASELPRYPSVLANTGHQCSTQCKWYCARRECDQVCSPMCAPPQCETLCTQASNECQTRCEAPRCAVICPSINCTSGQCERCRTVCAEPVCRTQCRDTCMNVCQKPVCTWNCHAGVCPHPSCHLVCSNSTSCLPRHPMRDVDLHPPYSDMVSSGYASFNHSILRSRGVSPLPWAWPTPPPTTVARSVSAPPSDGGPVRELKKKWYREDTRGGKAPRTPSVLGPEHAEPERDRP